MSPVARAINTPAPFLPSPVALALSSVRTYPIPESRIKEYLQTPKGLGYNGFIERDTGNTMNNTTNAAAALFLITVYVVKNDIRSLSHQTIRVGMGPMMDYMKDLAAHERADVREVTLAELFADYSELVRNATTAQLIQGGIITDHTGTYTIPSGPAALAMSYKQAAEATSRLMSGCRARGRRAELESIHDRARRLNTLMLDLDAAN